MKFGRKTQSHTEQNSGVVVLLCIAAFVGCSLQHESLDEYSESCDLAYRILRESIEQPDGWAAIHAAEGLIASGHVEDVRKAVGNTDAWRSGLPGLRVGIWRVKGRIATTDEARSKWINRIRVAAGDETATDNVVAIESLAKLRRPVSDVDSGQLKRLERLHGEEVMPFILWLQVNAGERDARESLLVLLSSDSAKARSRAAYVLRHVGGLSHEQWLRVAAAARDERSAPGATKMHLLASAYVLAQTIDDKEQLLEAMLRQSALSSSRSRYQFAAAIGQSGATDNIPLLIPMLADPDPDVRVAAATAMLRISRP